MREDRVGSEEVGGSHRCHFEAVYGLIVRALIQCDTAGRHSANPIPCRLIRRIIADIMKAYARLLPPPKASFFLFGLRGVGKSSWVARTFPKATRVDLLDESLFQQYLTDPGQFYRELEGLKKGSLVVVDEIQRLPALLNEVHRLIENRKLKFALLGSSAKKLRRSGTNLLGGRALSCAMYPLTPTELGKCLFRAN